jgi:hypothetical protein
MNLVGEASAAVPAALVQSAAGTAGGVAPVHITALAEGVMRTMTVAKMKTVAALVALAVLGTGIGWAASGGVVEPGDRPAAAAQDRPVRPGAEQPARDGMQTLNGRVVAVGKDRKSFTVEVQTRMRGGEPKRIALKLGEKTTVTYNGVGPDGAVPIEGYNAEVRFAAGADEVPATVTFTGPETARRSPNFTGLVVGVAKDGKSVTLRVRPPAVVARPDDVRELTIPFDDKTVIAFDGVGKDGAKTAERQHAVGWYADDGKTAAKITFTDQTIPTIRGEGEPDLVGKVVRAGDKAFALELPPTARGEEPKRVPVRIAERSVASFHNVGVDEAKIAVGLQARVWLAAGSEDTAARVAFTGTVPERWTVIPGKVVGVRQQKDGVVVIIEQPFPNRGQEPIRTDVLITPKTKTAYFGIGPGEAKPVDGLQASIRLLDGSKDTAGQATFWKPAPGRDR